MPVSLPLRPIATACVLAGITLLIYSFHLQATSLNADERLVMQQALAGHGPLFFHAADDRWLQPAAVYAAKAVHSVIANDYAGRRAATLVAALDVALLFACARLLFGSDLIAVIAALLLIATPAHFAYGRLGTESIFPLPFVLVALLHAIQFFTFDRGRPLMIAGIALGLGCYTHPAAPLTMGFLMLLIAGVMTRSHRVSIRTLSALMLGFGVALIPAAAWFATHPSTYPDTFGRWAIFQAHLRYPMDGVRAFLNWNTLGTRASLYWGFLDPSWLFFGGPFNVLMLPLTVLGLAAVPRVLRREDALLIGLGALIVPLAGSSFGVPRYIDSALAVVPFAALLMAAAVAWAFRRFQGSRT